MCIDKSIRLLYTSFSRTWAQLGLQSCELYRNRFSLSLRLIPRLTGECLSIMDKYATQGIRQSLYELFKQNTMQLKEDMDDFGCKIICLLMCEGFKA